MRLKLKKIVVDLRHNALDMRHMRPIKKRSEDDILVMGDTLSFCMQIEWQCIFDFPTMQEFPYTLIVPERCANGNGGRLMEDGGATICILGLKYQLVHEILLVWKEIRVGMECEQVSLFKQPKLPVVSIRADRSPVNFA